MALDLPLLRTARQHPVSHFGDLVRKLRKEKGLTLEAVAKKIGSHKGWGPDRLFVKSAIDQPQTVTHR
jgi:hypothetical protein